MGTPAELAVMRALPAGEPTVAGMSMKEMLQFGGHTTNHAGKLTRAGEIMPEMRSRRLDPNPISQSKIG